MALGSGRCGESGAFGRTPRVSSGHTVEPEGRAEAPARGLARPRPAPPRRDPGFPLLRRLPRTCGPGAEAAALGRPPRPWVQLAGLATIATNTPVPTTDGGTEPQRACARPGGQRGAVSDGRHPSVPRRQTCSGRRGVLELTWRARRAAASAREGIRASPSPHRTSL